jgi:hypothetical protein
MEAILLSADITMGPCRITRCCRDMECFVWQFPRHLMEKPRGFSVEVVVAERRIKSRKVGVADSRLNYSSLAPGILQHRSHAVHTSSFLTILVTSRAAYAPLKSPRWLRSSTTDSARQRHGLHHDRSVIALSYSMRAGLD